MTTETSKAPGAHTCSYACERPECIRAQRDELASRLTAPQPAAARGDVRGLVECLPLEVRATNGYDAAWVAGFNQGVLQSRQNLQRALAAEGVQAGEVEQRARELLEAECGRPLPLDVPVCAAHSAVVAALSQQPEARGVVDEAMARNAKRYEWLRAQDNDDFSFAVVKNPHFDVFDTPQELDAAIDAALTGERNG